MLPYLDANLWFHTHQIQIATVADRAALVEGSFTQRFATYESVDKTIVKNANLQTTAIIGIQTQFKTQVSRVLQVHWDIKTLITIIFGQCDEATQTEIALGDNYAADRDEGMLLSFLERVHPICFGGNDGGLTYLPYKQVVAVKSLNTYTNNQVHDPNGLKEQVKIKYEATKTIVGRFSNGTATLMLTSWFM